MNYDLLGEETKYLRWYKQICEQTYSDNYVENHHIFPRSMFPDWQDFSKFPWNKARLSAKAHMIAHFALYKHFKKISYGSKAYFQSLKAFTGMGFDRHGNRNYGKHYELFRKLHSEYMKTNNPAMRLDVKQKISQSRIGKPAPMKGKNHTAETKEKVSCGVKRFFESASEDYMLRHAETSRQVQLNMDPVKKLQINEKRKNTLQKFHESEDGLQMRQNLSDKFSGDGNPMYGIEPKVKGSKWMNNGLECKMVHDVETYLALGWVFGRINTHKFRNGKAK